MNLKADEIVARAAQLPAFPAIVHELLAALENEHATIGALANHIAHDPVITARVLSLANAAAMGGSHAPLRDLVAATSMIGLRKLSEIVMTVSLAEFSRQSRMNNYFWEHAIAVGICSQELAHHCRDVAPLHALVAGLLHDIGQLWMARFFPLDFQRARLQVASGRENICALEADFFGMTHGEVGEILCRHWHLPESVVAAVRHHHDPGPVIDSPLADVTHVAEVLSNALDLTHREDNRVDFLSGEACRRIGLDWHDEHMPYLFGRMEARTEFACRAFRK